MESNDEKIRKWLIDWAKAVNHWSNQFTVTKEEVIDWLERQGKIDLEHYKDSEDEKRKFVGYRFLKCKGDFLSFKEGETYWLEYVGKDNYNVRSDNLLGQTFHIKPVELYTVFRPITWFEKQDEMIRNDIIRVFKGEIPYTSEENAKRYIAWLEKQSNTLNPNKVIEWLNEHVPTKFEDMQNYVHQFKKDFEL